MCLRYLHAHSLLSWEFLTPQIRYTPSLLFSSMKERCVPRSCRPKRKRRWGASNSWMPHNPMRISPLLLSFWKDFVRVFYSKERLLCWFYSKKLEKKSSSQREKDQGRRRIFFLVRSLEEKRVLSIFFFIFLQDKYQIRSNF